MTKIISVLKPFWGLFYLCGFNSMYFEKPINIQQLMLNYLPVILGILGSLFVSVSTHLDLLHNITFRKMVGYYMEHAFTFLTTCTLLLSQLQLLIYRKKIISIIGRIESIELNLTYIYFKQNIFVGTLRRNYFFRVFLLYFTQAAAVVVIFFFQ